MTTPAQQIPAPESPLRARQRSLLHVARKYLRGEVKAEEFERVEQLFRPDYRTAMLTLAKGRRRAIA